MAKGSRSGVRSDLGGELVFVKLGGSLITDKASFEAPRHGTISRLASEIAEARAVCPEMRLVLGHGSGSFGHSAAKRYGTREGVHSSADWAGFAQTATAAQRLNRIVTSALWKAGVPVWALQPSASAICRDGELLSMAERPFGSALEHGLVPLVYGDVALDEERGGTIVSTEEIFVWLARRLLPQRVILVGDMPGVMPVAGSSGVAGQPIAKITPDTVLALLPELGESRGVDVTGGMLTKVLTMCGLVHEQPGLQVRLISGKVRGLLTRVLCSSEVVAGTVIKSG